MPEVASAPARILLVEDNPADVLLVREALQEHGLAHRLEVVDDGERALARVGSADAVADVVLLDLNMPRVPGREVLAALRGDPRWVRTPVIVITSSDSPRDREAVAALGANHYFRKPSGFDEFLALGALVREALGGETREVGRELGAPEATARQRDGDGGSGT